MLDRRNFIRAGLGVGVSLAVLGIPFQAKADFPDDVVGKLDEEVERLLKLQILDRRNRWFGGYPDSNGLVNPHSAGRLFERFVCVYVCPQSRFHQDDQIRQRIGYAVEHLNAAQNSSGNIDLLTTNFNSPPDTGFVLQPVACGAKLAQLFDEPEILEWITPFLNKAGHALSVGGIHTPNHRWVVGAALTQLNDIHPNGRYIARIDQWLAEGIDIDEDGMYTERSTTVYNAVTNNALVSMADKLKRPELLDPVRQNLDAMQYLLHANDEVVTEISRRQDLHTRGNLSRYWFALRYMAIVDQSGSYAAMLRPYEPDQIQLPRLMEYPVLYQPLPHPGELPARFEKTFSAAGVTRIRDGRLSATVIHEGSSRLFSVHFGKAALHAVRFATAFFGKGQCVPDQYACENGQHVWRQSLRGPYYQPLKPSRRVAPNGPAWSESRLEREQSEVCQMHYEVRLSRRDFGFELRIKAEGTDRVPLSIEFNLREGGKIDGAEQVAGKGDTYVMGGDMVTYTMGNDIMRFGPGGHENIYTQVRGALDKLPGTSVYITGFTPFEQTIRIELS